MTGPRRIVLSGCTPVAWKNGGGTTRVLAACPSWRLSVADITRAAAFSLFPRTLRRMALLAGQGVRLTPVPPAEGAAMQLDRPGDILSFDGALPLTGAPLEGASRVLNLMTDAGERIFTLEAVRPGVGGIRAVAFLSAHGCWEVTAGEERFTLPPDAALVGETPFPLAVTRPGALAYAVTAG